MFPSINIIVEWKGHLIYGTFSILWPLDIHNLASDRAPKIYDILSIGIYRFDPR